MGSLTLHNPFSHHYSDHGRGLCHRRTRRPATVFLRAPELATSSPPLTCCSINSFRHQHQTLASAPQTPATAIRGAETDAIGLLLKERIVYLGSDIDDAAADSIISQLLLLDAQDPTKDIRLFINSIGGPLSSALAIFDVIRLLRADVSTVALGFLASTATIILLGGAKGKRLAMPNTRIMIHQPFSGTRGPANDVEVQAREAMHNKATVIRIISEFTGCPYEQVEKDIDKDRYMSPIEAVEYGIIDEVIDRDSIIPVEPIPKKIKSTMYTRNMANPRKNKEPEIPDDEIY
ncbi:ATP-dependent Clp protease proteolytic subunit 4-chloroplastic [Striga hermonthica]|uniref:ATP-dependent Clp protease proteolytic subunit n=1 Tax=Striga hermonthica TaxID=68872 RepID=A0A9N7MNM1_STRHE|nr:ATP-dependent Clp protease proteolytic subunit 4-chloroplastic [Striga hermonthica]